MAFLAATLNHGVTKPQSQEPASYFLMVPHNSSLSVGECVVVTYESTNTYAYKCLAFFFLLFLIIKRE